MSDAVRALKDRASEQSAKGKWANALESWRQVVAAAPDDIAARQKVAEVLTKLGRNAEAVEVYEDVARRFAEQGLFFKASAVCRVLLGLDPKHQRTLELISALYTRKQPAPYKGMSGLTPPPQRPVEPPLGVSAVTPTEFEVDLEIPIFEGTLESGLPSIPLFSTLEQSELKEILGTAMEVRAYADGDLIVQEGAPGDSMFALVEGEAGVFRGWGSNLQRQVAELGAGTIFGEVSLGSGAPRVATVVAKGEAIALEFPRESMAQVAVRHPNVGERLAEFCRERLLANALRASPLFRALDEHGRRAVGSCFRPCSFTKGQRIVTQGLETDGVHMLLRGVCQVLHPSGQRYPDMREGDLFGEVSALTQGTATASVVAAGPVLTLRLSTTDLEEKVLSNPQARLAVKQLANERLQRTAQFDQVLRDDSVQDRRV
jgi:CRP-like cAMP-binding protein